MVVELTMQSSLNTLLDYTGVQKGKKLTRFFFKKNQQQHFKDVCSNGTILTTMCGYMLNTNN